MLHTLEKEVFLIKVNKSDRPIFLKRDENGKESSKLYIRRQASATAINDEELYNYIKDHF